MQGLRRMAEGYGVPARHQALLSLAGNRATVGTSQDVAVPGVALPRPSRAHEASRFFGAFQSDLWIDVSIDVLLGGPLATVTVQHIPRVWHFFASYA